MNMEVKLIKFLAHFFASFYLRFDDTSFSFIICHFLSINFFY